MTVNLHSIQNVAPAHRSQLRAWFIAEWGSDWPELELHTRPPEENDQVTVPQPLFALEDDVVLVGGLAFSAYAAPQDEILAGQSSPAQATAIWINGVLVAPDFRGRGVASLLVQHACAIARRAELAHLFALTDVPVLYQKLGWRRISESVDEPGSWVVGVTL